ncbi:peptidogalycan biosysnthesis protein [Orbaceae bacterium ESL0721]|nr:peptidogalycan biosysnthesis protein [Orbaceae bacterium ESL0721]
MNYLNQLEPNALIDDFLTHPPDHFSAWLSEDGVPLFAAKFDLLTTAQSDFKAKLKKIPFYKSWKSWLQPKTCFVGTTVSEYALLTNQVDASTLAMHIKQRYAKVYPLLIVKDLPIDSPLQNDESNQYSTQFVTALKKQNFIEVEGQALAFVPIDFTDIDQFFNRFSYSRRKNFRRKLKSQKQLTIKVLSSGDDVFFQDQLIDEYYQLYQNVYDQSEIHFDKLTKPFFKQLLQSKSSNARIFTYYDSRNPEDKKLIGYNICFIVNNMLVDKYIGLVYPAARELNLYYVSWFYNLEYALQHRLTHYIAGWTDPEVKASLGASFTFTKHLVYVRNPLLRVILAKLSRFFESDKEKTA